MLIKSFMGVLTIKKLSEFFNEVDIITYEFENISTQTLKTIMVEKKIYPPLNALSIAQDRKKEKTFLKKQYKSC